MSLPLQKAIALDPVVQNIVLPEAILCTMADWR